MSRPLEIFKLNTFELPRRSGEMKEYELDIELIEKVGVELMAVQVGEIIEVDARLESVTEGVLLSAQIFALATGECIRCLDPVEIEIDRRIQELYLYEQKTERKRHTPAVDDLDIEDELLMEGDYMDLEIPIRDAICLSLPINPLCSDDCLGLCPECGLKWVDLGENHVHETIDARWASLADLATEEPDFKN